MEFGLSNEQQLLKESVERFVEKDYTFAARNALLATPEHFSREHWRRFAELGWLGVGLPEQHGGFGGGAVEHMVVCEAFGRAMVLEPYISSAVLGARALALADDEQVAAPLLAGIAGGEQLVALAFSEAAARYDLHHVETRARPAGNMFRLSGRKIAVLDGPSADVLIVAARVSGDPRDASGIGLFLVERSAEGLSVDGYPTMDGARAADLILKDTPAEQLVAETRGLEVLEQAVEWGIAARCAQAVGGMDASFRQTLDYVKTREQFDVPIGSFQVLQHRLVDMFIAVRECQSMMRMVANGVMEDDAPARRAAVSAAKMFIGKRARKVAQEVVQMHGGVGMTEELSIGHFFRTLTLFCSAFGSTDYHLERYAALTRG